MAGVSINNSILSSLGINISSNQSLLVTLLFFTAVIAVYAVFVHFFYKHLAKKNILKLNLNQYNTSEHPLILKTFASVFYVIEYLIILPVLTFVWFTVLSILILLLSKGLPLATILLISAALVASVRITSYVSQQLSQDLAKMLPFTLLAVAITTQGFFDINALLQRFNEIPHLFSNLLYYLIFIIVVELIMRSTDLINLVLKTKSEESKAIKFTSQ